MLVVPILECEFDNILVQDKGSVSEVLILHVEGDEWRDEGDLHQIPHPPYQISAGPGTLSPTTGR